VRGRARFKIPALHHDHGLKHTLEAGLGGNGIRSVSASACTGNVLILFDPSRPLDEIERRVREVAARGAGRSPSILSEGPSWHSIDAEKVLATLDSRSAGLTKAAANVRRRRHGTNLLTKIARRTGFEILLDQFGTLPVALLAGTALISLMTGGLIDAAIVLAVIAVNGIIGFVSETWTEQTIASLEGNAVPTARVRRDGDEQVVPAESLVPGDVIALHGSDVAGDPFPDRHEFERNLYDAVRGRERPDAAAEPRAAIVDQPAQRCPASDGAGARTAGSGADGKAPARSGADLVWRRPAAAREGCRIDRGEFRGRRGIGRDVSGACGG
jgi:hypothetical protein